MTKMIDSLMSSYKTKKSTIEIQDMNLNLWQTLNNTIFAGQNGMNPVIEWEIH